ncbi:uncharacterized protein AMSG_11785, partial [Thecamonas trahens ATCC 50062]
MADLVGASSPSKRKRDCGEEGSSASRESKVARLLAGTTGEHVKTNSISARPKATATRVVRIRRKGGKVVVDCDVYIGRNMFMGGWRLKRSKWANPFSVKSAGSHAAACAAYERYVRAQPDLMAALSELNGKTLGCWCKPKPCHGDVLVKLVAEAGRLVPEQCEE